MSVNFQQEEGWMKINFDVNSKEITSPSGARIVAQDCNREIVAFGERITLRNHYPGNYVKSWRIRHYFRGEIFIWMAKKNFKWGKKIFCIGEFFLGYENSINF